MNLPDDEPGAVEDNDLSIPFALVTLFVTQISECNCLIEAFLAFFLLFARTCFLFKWLKLTKTPKFALFSGMSFMVLLVLRMERGEVREYYCITKKALGSKNQSSMKKDLKLLKSIH